MSEGSDAAERRPSSGLIKGPQDFWGGIAVIAIALFSFYAGSDLPGHSIGNPLKQFKIFGSERLGFRLGRESMGESSTDLAPRLRKRCLGEGDHKCVERQPKSVVETHYMEGCKQSQFVDNRRSPLNHAVLSTSPWTDAPSKLARILLS